MGSAERIQVTLQGGAPWGFRLSGGGPLPLTINKIRKKSQAHLNGLLEGDAVISINGIHVHDKSQDEALELVEKAGDTLSLEIFRGDIGDGSREKPRKAILVAGGIVTTQTVDQVTSSPFTKTSSIDNVTSDSFETAESDVSHGGFKITTTVNDTYGSTYKTETSSGLVLTATVDDMSTSTHATQVVESSPVISVQAGDVYSSEYTNGQNEIEIESTSLLPSVMATPFSDSTVIADAPSITLSPSHQHLVTQVRTDAPNLETSYGSRSPHSRSPVPPPVSPKPTFAVATPPPPPSTSPIPSGVTSVSSYATFDDGQTRREVTRQNHVQRSDDGSRSTVVQQETSLTTRNLGPSYVKSQQTAFNAVHSTAAGNTQRSSSKTSTTLLTTTSVVNKKGPTPFTSSGVSSNIQLPPIQQSGLTGSLSSGNLSSSAPLFKPTKFVPGSGKKDVPGLYPPTSPLVDAHAGAMFKHGKENAPPPPMFQVKKIVSEKSDQRGRDIWRPNVWLPEQEPQELPGSSAMTPTDDSPNYFTLPFARKPGQSLIEEQKRKLFQSQISTSSKTDHEEYYMDGHEAHHEPHHGHHKRVHVFAPPVVIQAEDDIPYSAYEEQLLADDDDGGSSQASSSIRKKKLYNDSAFYDAPGKNYPTISEQMKLCKKIAQSLTSAANRRARGAKMFMKRKRKSTKWIHEGQSEFSSSAGDVANLHELDSELSPEEGGTKPLLYFKIPSLKHRVSSEGKQTKMALTQEEFEKLRLNAKKCEHRAVAPDTCFDIVADLKAHKGKGGRMFEKRKQRSDKFVIDETNAKYVPPTHNPITNHIKAMRSEKTPWEAAMENQGKVDAAFSQLTEWERNQRLNQSANSKNLAPLDLAPMPAVKATLRSDDSPHILRGKNFNRTARGWAGGGEYPVAHHLRPVQVEFAKTHGPMQPTQNITRQRVQPSQIAQEPAQPSPVPQFAQRGRQPPVAPKPQNTTWHPPSQDVPYASNQGTRQPVRNETWQHDNVQSSRQDIRQQTSRQDDWRRNEMALSRQRGGAEGDGFRQKGWQADHQNHRDAFDYSYAPVDYNFGAKEYPKVAYMQPIIPGTDL